MIIPYFFESSSYSLSFSNWCCNLVSRGIINVFASNCRHTSQQDQHQFFFLPSLSLSTSLFTLSISPPSSPLISISVSPWSLATSSFLFSSTLVSILFFSPFLRIYFPCFCEIYLYNAYRLYSILLSIYVYFYFIHFIHLAFFVCRIC